MPGSAGAINGSLPGLTLKAWAIVQNAGAAATLIKGFNVASVTFVTTGSINFAFNTAFLSNTYVIDFRCTDANFLTTAQLQPAPTAATVSQTTAGCQVRTVAQGAAANLGLYYVGFYE